MNDALPRQAGLGLRIRLRDVGFVAQRDTDCAGCSSFAWSTRLALSLAISVIADRHSSLRCWSAILRTARSSWPVFVLRLLESSAAWRLLPSVSVQGEPEPLACYQKRFGRRHLDLVPCRGSRRIFALWDPRRPRQGLRGRGPL